MAPREGPPDGHRSRACRAPDSRQAERLIVTFGRRLPVRAIKYGSAGVFICSGLATLGALVV
mgnify:CR=1 FL=1